VTDATETTLDRFLNGRLLIQQPRTGYRAGTDPVLLAAAAPARAGDSVLELGCGAGVASLCLAARVADVRVTGIEVQPLYAGLARRNAAANGLALDVIEGSFTGRAARQSRFDVVMANPPYFTAGAGTPAGDAGREAAFREDTPLEAWIDAALRRTKDGGWLCFIHLAERLSDLLAPLAGRAGDIAILPIAARTGRPASRIIMRARKGSRAPLRLLQPLVMHAAAEHLADGDDYSPEARSVLRDGAALSGFS
jgi:tRNA1(Val) A37 N6-methylase TrmN6